MMSTNRIDLTVNGGFAIGCCSTMIVVGRD